MKKAYLWVILLGISGCKAENSSPAPQSNATPTEKISAHQQFQQNLQIYLNQKSQNDEEALVLLGETYTFCPIKKRDYAKAYTCFEKAAAKGHARALNHQAWLLQMGRGITQDRMRAQSLWKQSCDGGYALACTRLKPEPSKRTRSVKKKQNGPSSSSGEAAL